MGVEWGGRTSLRRWLSRWLRRLWAGWRRSAALAWVVLLAWGAVLLPTSHAWPLEDVPFITTPDKVTVAMLELASVRAGDHLIDLGSGDGRIVITAAKRFGASGLGVEIVPDLVQRSRLAAQQAGVQARVQFVEQDLFATDLSPASVVTMYLLPDVNLQLRPKLLMLKPGTRVVSHDWDMGDWPADRMLTIDVPDKAIGREKLSRVFLWVVPAPVQGLWCAPDGRSLQLQQRYQAVHGSWGHGDERQAVAGRLDGTVLRLQGASGEARLEWQQHGGQLRLRGEARGEAVMWRLATEGRC